MEDCTDSLCVFDKDGNGFINSAELCHVLTSLGECVCRLCSNQSTSTVPFLACVASNKSGFLMFFVSTSATNLSLQVL